MDAFPQIRQCSRARSTVRRLFRKRLQQDGLLLSILV